MDPELKSFLIEAMNADVVWVISQFVGYPKKKKVKHSPMLQKELIKLQCSPLIGANEMYLRELDDFILE
jgi:hypothetical protein